MAGDSGDRADAQWPPDEGGGGDRAQAGGGGAGEGGGAGNAGAANAGAHDAGAQRQVRDDGSAGRADDSDAGGQLPDARPTWDQVAERYGPRVYQMALRLTGDPDEAADLAQDVFVRVYRNLHRYRPGTFEGWLYRITKNLFIDRIRKRARIRMQPLGEGDSQTPPSGDPGPADVVERRTLEHRLQAALDGLPHDFRLAVVLCDVEGLPYEEIAAVTGWPLGTVRSRIHRGRRQLRDALERQPLEGADA